MRSTWGLKQLTCAVDCCAHSPSSGWSQQLHTCCRGASFWRRDLRVCRGSCPTFSLASSQLNLLQTTGGISLTEIHLCAKISAWSSTTTRAGGRQPSKPSSSSAYTLACPATLRSGFFAPPLMSALLSRRTRSSSMITPT
eukprot:753676-Hanusia_phi.AAC.2